MNYFGLSSALYAPRRTHDERGTHRRRRHRRRDVSLCFSGFPRPSCTYVCFGFAQRDGHCHIVRFFLFLGGILKVKSSLELCGGHHQRTARHRVSQCSQPHIEYSIVFVVRARVPTQTHRHSAKAKHACAASSHCVALLFAIAMCACVREPRAVSV